MARLRVLVIDSDQAICDLFVELLTRDGIDVSAIANPRQGLEMFRTGASYHLLILAASMEMSGIDLLAQIREFDKDVAVLVTLSHPVVWSERDPSSLDISGYLQKPFYSKDLRELIARIVRERGITVG